jgi:methylated-DNA-[protein]-cysteine S-methyltransferase
MGMDKILIQTYKTSYGELLIGAIKDKVCLCDWRYRKARKVIDKRLCKYFKAEIVNGKHQVIDQVMNQLEEYLIGKRFNFNVPIAIAGTDFQQSVWHQLQAIPFGQTITYRKLAERLANVKAVRAVANATGANALSILVPCHRVIGSDGQLTGYAGGIEAKQQLIYLENPNSLT